MSCMYVISSVKSSHFACKTTNVGRILELKKKIQVIMIYFIFICFSFSFRKSSGNVYLSFCSYSMNSCFLHYFTKVPKLVAW